MLCASAENIRSSVTFEFKGMAVKLTGYLLKSFRNRSNGYHLRNLVIEAFNKKTGDWDVIHEENDFEGLNGQSKIFVLMNQKKSSPIKFG